MLIALLTQHPEALGAMVRGTPAWVWALAAGLLAVGASQLRDRRASLTRITAMPLAMAGFSAWGTASAFSAAAVLPQLMAVWLAATVAVATQCCPAPDSAITCGLPMRRASRAWPMQLLILCAPVWLRSSRLR